MKNRLKKVSLTNKILLLEILFIVVVSIYLSVVAMSRWFMSK